MSFFEELSPDMDRYLESHTSVEPEILKKLRKETFQKTTQPHMISGIHQGRLLSIISKLISPKKILEIGTFTGYATLCLAEGLQKDGKLYTIDINEDLSYIPSKYFEQSEYCNQIEFVLADAKQHVKTMEVTFDLVFIDADKDSYPEYLEIIKPKMRSGGIILIDNVLWYGKVLDENGNKTTENIKRLNQLVAKDEELESVILPIRDGIYLIRKK